LPDKASIPRVVVAGLRGGAGKTTLSVGLVRAWRKRGLQVVSFKKGPDYIDAGWLAQAARSPCYNLDPFLIGEERVLSSFLAHAGGADCAVIEGNRGLFDGMDAEGSQSTARVARILKSPVILIVDCTKATRTVAALVYGARRFERGVRVAGVVLNNIAGARHEAVTRQAVERLAGVPVLGAIPRLGGAEFPERHMGLVPWQEHPEVESAVEATGELVTRYIDLERAFAVARSAPPLTPVREAERPPAEGAPGPPRVGVVRDRAFQFYYPENFEELRRRGAEVVEVSALGAHRLPPGLDALYIGGGFPETHALALAGNGRFRRSLRQAVEEGLPVYAECGGLMYLGESLRLKGKRHPMAGVFPVSFLMHERPRAHGYTVARVVRANPFFRRGTVLRGHEFHYSEVADPEALPGEAALAFRMERGTGIARGRDGLFRKRAFGTYTHLHALGSPEWAEGMMRAAGQHRRARKRP
jgi:cobyrinic acid a,c-diamide synthase